LVGAVRIQPLDRRLGLGLDPDIADRADPDIEGAALRVDYQRPVLAALDDAKDGLSGQHLGAIGSTHRFALIGWHISDGLRLRQA
jgi:hypothetical protein